MAQPFLRAVDYFVVSSMMEVEQVDDSIKVNWAKEIEAAEAIEEEEKLKLERCVLEKLNLKSNDNKRKRQTSDSRSQDEKKRFNRPKRSSSAEALDRIETDRSILERRQKTIDYGKNTVGYTNYRKQVPIENRTKLHPRTPDKYYKYSRRSWDQLIKTWRKQLHAFDSNAADTVKTISLTVKNEAVKVKDELEYEQDSKTTVKEDPEQTMAVKRETDAVKTEATVKTEAAVKNEPTVKPEPQPLVEFDYSEESDDSS